MVMIDPQWFEAPEGYRPAQSPHDLRRLYLDNDFTLRDKAAMYARRHPPTLYANRARTDVGKFARSNKTPIVLYRYLDYVLRELHGDNFRWTPQYQKYGTCVGQGGKVATDLVMAVSSASTGRRFVGRAAVGPMYGGSRVEVGRSPGRWEGSTGFWLVDWLLRWGVALLKDLGLPDDALDADENFGMRWAASRDGVPSEIETLAREMPITHSSVAETPDDVHHALSIGAPTLTCSPLIATGRRGRFGVSPLEHVGGHCQVITAVHFTPSGERIFTQQNSWSADWGDGEVYPDDMPPGAVNITEADLQRQLRSQDCHVVEGITGQEPLPDDLF